MENNYQNDLKGLEKTTASAIKLYRTLNYIQFISSIMGWAAILIGILFKLLEIYPQLVTPIFIAGVILCLVSWAAGSFAKPTLSKIELIKKSVEERIKEINEK